MLYVLDSHHPEAPFPPVDKAELEPNGLLAIGGDLSSARLLNAYRAGIFPWYSEHQPILWWSPDPRLVLFPRRIRITRSLRKTLKNQAFEISLDRAFGEVIDACSAPRAGQDGTWITPEMRTAYIALHRQGYAHSVEVRLDGQLVGGLYGVAIGRVFFGESMFTRARDASKVALVWLTRILSEWEFVLIDCQVYSVHLISMGAEEMKREDFCREIGRGVELPGIAGSWNRLTAGDL